MTEVTAISAQTAALLVHYGFDLGGFKAEKLAGQWLTQYPGSWLRLAVIEALYEGRYKAVSVGQLLRMWQRLGQPLYHFNGEFERLVCSNLPQGLTLEGDAKLLPEEVSLPIGEPDDAADIDLSGQPIKEPDRPQDAESQQIENAEIQEVPAVDRTGESAEVVIVSEADLAITALADRAEKPEEWADKPAENSFPTVKHTDFHLKLTAIAKAGQRKKGERRKKSEN